MSSALEHIALTIIFLPVILGVFVVPILTVILYIQGIRALKDPSRRTEQQRFFILLSFLLPIALHLLVWQWFQSSARGVFIGPIFPTPLQGLAFLAIPLVQLGALYLSKLPPAHRVRSPDGVSSERSGQLSNSPERTAAQTLDEKVWALRCIGLLIAIVCIPGLMGGWLGSGSPRDQVLSWLSTISFMIGSPSLLLIGLYLNLRHGWATFFRYVLLAEVIVAAGGLIIFLPIFIALRN